MGLFDDPLDFLPGAGPVIQALDPLIPGPDVGAKADDLLVKDTRMPLSEALVKYGGQGWRKNSAYGKQARAIVMGESSGNPDAQNACCTGLFQLNAVHAGKWGSPKDPAEFRKWAKDPANNIAGAYKLWNTVGRRWSPTWSAFGSPAYAAALASGVDPIITIKKGSATGTVGDAVSDAVNAAVNPFKAVADAAVALIGTLLSADTWFRIGKTGLGLTLVILGGAVFVFVIANKASGGAVKRSAVKSATGKLPG